MHAIRVRARAKTDLHCVIVFVSMVEALKSVVFFCDCPQCNDLYQCRSFIHTSLDLHAHINIATGDVVKLFILIIIQISNECFMNFIGAANKSAKG